MVLSIALTAGAAHGAKPIGITGRTQDAIRDADGTVHLLWTEGTLGNAGVRRGVLDPITGQVTGNEQVGSGVDAAFGRPLLALGPSGTLHAVWTENQSLIRHAARGTDGKWTLEPVIVEGDPIRYTQPSLVLRADGRCRGRSSRSRWRRSPPTDETAPATASPRRSAG